MKENNTLKVLSRILFQILMKHSFINSINSTDQSAVSGKRRNKQANPLKHKHTRKFPRALISLNQSVRK